MKYLAILFCIYFILLALLPCQDTMDKIANIYHTSIEKHSEHNDGCREICSPFCTCACCSTARQIISKTTITLFVPLVNRTYPAQQIPSIQEQAKAIWQPPQIG